MITSLYYEPFYSKNSRSQDELISFCDRRMPSESETFNNQTIISLTASMDALRISKLVNTVLR